MRMLRTTVALLTACAGSLQAQQRCDGLRDVDSLEVRLELLSPEAGDAQLTELQLDSLLRSGGVPLVSGSGSARAATLEVRLDVVTRPELFTPGNDYYEYRVSIRACPPRISDAGCDRPLWATEEGETAHRQGPQSIGRDVLSLLERFADCYRRAHPVQAQHRRKELSVGDST